ncbi:pilus assembly protein [uncultured Methanobrevibacter sp.]|uniref:pilus assembly protein n=1 Tax=uncultured Methanobrevibacter sp. TaxID=253161 RepID=UPI00263733C4|nr:pilus assembly protein [uncultured Methanobrevibacter sp.]
MEITVERMAMIREDYNPKNTNLNLDVDWAVEYTNTDQRDINYIIVLKSSSNLNLNFKVEGLIRLDIFEEFIQQECSQIVFHHACTMLMNMISLTRQSSYELFKEDISSTINLNAAF